MNDIWIDLNSGTWGTYTEGENLVVLTQISDAMIEELELMGDWEIIKYGKTFGEKV